MGCKKKSNEVNSDKVKGKKYSLNTNISDVEELGTVCKGSLTMKGITRVGDLRGINPEELSHVCSGFGMISVKQIEWLMDYVGLEIKSSCKKLSSKEVTRSTDLHDTILSNRIANCLKRNGKFTVGDVLCMSGDEILSLKGIGSVALRELTYFLDEIAEFEPLSSN